MGCVSVDLMYSGVGRSVENHRFEDQSLSKVWFLQRVSIAVTAFEVNLYGNYGLWDQSMSAKLFVWASASASVTVFGISQC